jgi:hypothetical protein
VVEDATEAGALDAVAAARAAGQAAAVAHMFDHSSHAATYAAKAIGLHGGGPAPQKAERTAVGKFNPRAAHDRLSRGLVAADHSFRSP